MFTGSTLPDAVAFGDLRPGDLMFVEATYRSGRHKQQRMNIVHVEIFVGGDSVCIFSAQLSLLLMNQIIQTQIGGRVIWRTQVTHEYIG